MAIDDFKLRTKMLIPVVLLSLTLLAMVGVGASKLAEISAAASEIIEQRDAGATTIVRIRAAIMMNTAAVLGTLVYDSDKLERRSAEADFEASVKEGADKFDAAIRSLPDQAAKLAELKRRFLAVAEKSKAPFDVGRNTPGLTSGDKLKATEFEALVKGVRDLGDIDAETRALITDLRALSSSVLAQNVVAAAELRARSHDALVVMAAMGVSAALLVGAFAVWMCSTKVARPLAQICEKMKALAKGDLRVEIEGQTRKDEIGDMAAAVQVFKVNAIERLRAENDAASQRAAAETERERVAAERARAAAEQSEVVRRLGAALKDLAAGNLTARLDDGFTCQYAQIKSDFNEAAQKLMETVRTVITSTTAIKSGTREIAAASDDLSLRTEQQAASLEETAAALEQITATLKKSAQGAKHAAEVVATADDDAKKGAVVVTQAVAAVGGIARSSQEISQIIGVIDEIAFQTNLLALNAGVEAARAGDAGKGFAVVASEVRALAQRSAEAAKQIKSLISNSSREVGSGVKLVGETGLALERIIAQVSEINRVVADFAAAAQEQSNGLEQVNKAISQMDQTTQQNATMVEESTAANHSLSQETNVLARLVEQFHVGAEGRIAGIDSHPLPLKSAA